VADIWIDGDDDAQLAVRFNIYQLLIAGPRHDSFVNIGAKTLSGFGYRGHSFWDTEVFMLPFFTYVRPDIARNLLSYRFHNLPGARQKAQANGYQGAQYPWESAGTGEEVTPTWVPHPTDRTKLVRIWTGDIEIHVSADIAYAIMQYWRLTGDHAFMRNCGARIILETARFWASRAEWNAAANRYEYNDVIGPDEYHDHIDNNAYTNYFARWHLLSATDIASWLEQTGSPLLSALNITGEELASWREIAGKIYFAQDPQTRIIEQFEGYYERKPVDLQSLEPRTISVQELFGIEGANSTQVLKQPDVLMLLYLHPEAFDDHTVRANYDYYTPRTDHTFGSSLGPAIQAIMACRVGEIGEAYEHFQRAAQADLYDVRGNAGDGIHGASAGGLWQAVVLGFAGLQWASWIGKRTRSSPRTGSSLNFVSIIEEFCKTWTSGLNKAIAWRVSELSFSIWMAC
jgi:kojibiose phosphorylase